MRKIRNPYAPVATKEQYNCFGCSPHNEIGLCLEFFENGDEILAVWKPEKKYEGWTGVLHGGIQATLIDEAAAWFVFVKLGTSGVTSGLNVEYIKPVYISKGNITVTAKLVSHEKTDAVIKCTLTDGEGEICAEATAKYFCYPEKIARARYNYPGSEAFFSE